MPTTAGDASKPSSRWLRARIFNLSEFSSTSRDETADWAGQAAEIADRLIVVGGDGTLNAVLDGLPAGAPTDSSIEAAP